MLNFLGSKQIEKEISLPFKVHLELQDDSFFLASCPFLPGCVARGRTKSEALKNISEAIQHHLNLRAQPEFEVVWQDATHPTWNGLSAFLGRLVASSNRDGALSSAAGDYGSWNLNPVTRAGLANTLGPLPGEQEAEDGEKALGLVDYTPQIYCLTSFSDTGVPKLFAGSSASGSIYESVDGINWELSFATGEARVHALASFQNRLYAGTSASGKLYCLSGGHWSQVHRSHESAVTALIEFQGQCYMGSYPGGHIYASDDGLNWHLSYDSEQTFVRAFAVFQGSLYAATSKAGGGMVFRSKDGRRWEKVFESKDPNYYCLHVFQQRLWLGTGNNGKLYHSLDGDSWSLGASLEDEGIRAMEVFQGRLYLAAEGQGRIYRSLFSQDLPPELSEIRVTDVTSHSAVLRWRSDRACDSRVYFGPDESYGASSYDGQAVFEHQVTLSQLKSLETYHFKILSRCPDHSEAAFSRDLVFSTSTAEAPKIHSSSHPDSSTWYASGDCVLSWEPTEALLRYHYHVDHEPHSVPQPGAPGVLSSRELTARLDGLQDGEWWFHLLGEDRAGNLSVKAGHYRLGVDTQALPPALSSPSHPIEGAWNNRQRFELRLQAPQDLSGIKGYYVLLDQEPDSVPQAGLGQWIQDSSCDFEMPHDGDWYAHAVSVDKAGNVGSSASSYRLRLDRRADPPLVASASHPDPSRWVNSGNVEFSWTPPQDASGIAGYYYLFDQRPESVPSAHSGIFSMSTHASFSGKGDGLWYFHIVSTDQAGNVGTEAAHFPVRIDTWAAAPRLHSPSHPAKDWMASSTVRVEIEAPDDLSGIVGFFHILDQERLTRPTLENGSYSASGVLEFEGVKDGQWYLHAVSKDRAGNVGVEASHLSLRIDTEAKPPRLQSASHPRQDDWSRQRLVDMAWDVPEDLSGVVQYYGILDRDPLTVPTVHSGHAYTENHARLEIMEDGLWYFHVVTQDRAGNNGTQAGHYALRIDTSAAAPKLSCPTHPDRSAWSNDTRPRFEWLEPEDASGIAGYYYNFDRNPETIPTPVNAFFSTAKHAVIDRGLDEDGTWYFHIVSRDRAGNVGSVAAHYPIHLDTTAPPPLLQSPSHPDKHAWNKNPNPVFQWEAPPDPSGIAGYYYLLNHSQSSVPSEGNGVWTEETRAAFAGLEDGVWTLHVVSRDHCGNVGAEAAHYSIRIDTQALPPLLQSPTHPEDSWSRNASPSFTWTPPQDLSGIAGYYTLLDREPSTVPSKEKGDFSTGSLANFSKLEDGVWIFHVVSVDQAGNVGTRAAHCSVRIDTRAEAPKVISNSHPDPEKWYRLSRPQFSWAIPSDPSGISGFYYCVDQATDTVPGPQSSWTSESQVQLDPHPDGDWVFHAVTKDGAGNISVEAFHFRFRIDSSVPRPSISSKTHPRSEDYYGNPRPSFTWEDGDDLSGITGHYWVFDKQPLTPVLAATAPFTTASSVALTPQKDGTWFFHLAAKDEAGNVSEAAHFQCRIETGAPSSKLEARPDVSSATSFELQWRGEDRVSGVASYDLEFRTQGGTEWSPWLTETTALSGIFSGHDGVTYEFRVRATDRAGNQEAFDSQGPFAKVTVDLKPPQPVRNLAAKPSLAGSISLSWSPSSDEVSGVAHYEIHRSSSSGSLGLPVGKTDAVGKTFFSDPGSDLVDGALYYYCVVPVDRAGNRCLEGNDQASSVCDRSAKAPVLSSSSHPMTLDWYKQPDARLAWETPADSTGVEGYYWSVDQSLQSVPGPKNGNYLEANELEVKGLKDGTWYVHVSTKDCAGNVSTEAAHYQVNVALSKPAPPQPRCSTHPSPDTWSGASEALFSWNTPQAMAKIAGYYTLLDQNPSSVPNASTGRWAEANQAVYSDLGDGIWYFHVVSKDGAGNVGDQAGHVRIQIARSPPPPKLSSSTHPRPGESSNLRQAAFEWAAPTFSEPITAYHFSLDREKDTVPDAHDARSSEGKAQFSALADGDWYVHVVSVGASGRLGKVASHYPLHIRSAGTLQGQVTKANGILPSEGVLVEAFFNGKSVAKASTNKEGRFRFEGLELGEYLLKLDAPGLPPQLLDAVRVMDGEVNISLSTEVCAVPSPSAGAKELRFYVLTKEAGSLSLKIYKESGTVMASLEAPALRPVYQKLAWDISAVEPGIYLYQATLSAQGGKVLKYPIRKVQIT